MKIFKRTSKHLIYILIFFHIFIAYGESAQNELLLNSKPIPKVIAIVNGEKIDSSFLVNQLKIWELTRLRQGLAVNKKDKNKYALELLNKAIDKELLFQRGKNKNIKIQKKNIQNEIKNIQKKFPNMDAFLAALAFQNLTMDRLSKKIEKRLVEDNLIRIEIAPKVDVTQQKAEETYKKNEEKYVTSKKYRVSHIFISSTNNDLNQIKNKQDLKKATRFSKLLDLQAKDLLEFILRALKQGGDFAELAKKNSEDEESRQKGGDLGDIDLNQILPELALVISKLKPGGISEVIKTSFGYHILKLNKITPQRKIAFKEVETDILNSLLKIEVERKKKEYVSELRRLAKIEILL